MACSVSTTSVSSPRGVMMPRYELVTPSEVPRSSRIVKRLGVHAGGLGRWSVPRERRLLYAADVHIGHRVFSHRRVIR